MAAAPVMGTVYGTKIDEWRDIDSVSDFDRGPPITYSVDSRDVVEVILAVIKFYDDHWFGNCRNS